MWKKILINLGSKVVIEALLQYAIKQRNEGGLSEDHYTRWDNIISFLMVMKEKGLPL